MRSQAGRPAGVGGCQLDVTGTASHRHRFSHQPEGKGSEGSAGFLLATPDPDVGRRTDSRHRRWAREISRPPQPELRSRRYVTVSPRAVPLPAEKHEQSCSLPRVPDRGGHKQLFWLWDHRPSLPGRQRWVRCPHGPNLPVVSGAAGESQLGGVQPERASCRGHGDQELAPQVRRSIRGPLGDPGTLSSLSVPCLCPAPFSRPAGSSSWPQVPGRCESCDSGEACWRLLGAPSRLQPRAGAWRAAGAADLPGCMVRGLPLATQLRQGGQSRP